MRLLARVLFHLFSRFRPVASRPMGLSCLLGLVFGFVCSKSSVRVAERSPRLPDPRFTADSAAGLRGFGVFIPTQALCASDEPAHTLPTLAPWRTTLGAIGVRRAVSWGSAIRINGPSRGDRDSCICARRFKAIGIGFSALRVAVQCGRTPEYGPLRRPGHADSSGCHEALHPRSGPRAQGP